MTRYRATFSGAPAFAYDVLSRMREPENAAPLDLSAWAVAFCGAEPIRPEILRRFSRRFAAVGLRPNALAPCYGLAEFTLMATSGGADERMRFTPFTPAGGPPGEVCEVGEVITGHRLRIVDPISLDLLEDGCVGEVVLDGPSKASGYWNRPSQTHSTFAVTIAGEEGAFLRTGDLGFVRNGRLNIVGRRKEMLIVRGRSMHPAELEAAACSSHPRVKAAAAFSLSTGGVGILCETRSSDAPAQLFQSVQRQLARLLSVNAELIALVRPGAIPRTTSGKVQRLACSELLESGAIRTFAVWRATGPARDLDLRLQIDAAAIREWLLSYLADHIGLDIASLDEAAPLQSFGIDSMGAVQLACALEDWLRMPLESTVLWQAPSLGALCRHLEHRFASGAPERPARVGDGECPLTLVESMSEQQVQSLSNRLGALNGGLN